MNGRLTRIALAAMMVGLFGFAGKAMAGAATVTSVSPNLSDIAGGERVEIVGTNFAGSTDVTFGGTTVGVGNFTILSATLISAVTPAHVKGCVDVVVVNPGGNGTLTDGLAYTSFNRVLQVSVRVKIGENSRIHWGVGTVNDDTLIAKQGGAAHGGGVGDINNYIWFVRDCDYGVPPAPAQVSLSGVYTTDTAGAVFTADDDNGKTLNVQNDSTTASAIDLSAVVSNSVPSAGAVFWSPGAAAGAETFRMRADLGGGGITALGPVAAQVRNEMPVGTELLLLELSTPTATAAAFTVTHTITLSLIASVD